MKLNLSVVAIIAATGIASVNAFQVGSSFGLKITPKAARAPYATSSSGKSYARNVVVLYDKSVSDRLADATKNITDAFNPDKGKNITTIGGESKSDKAKKVENKVKSGNQKSTSDYLADATKNISQSLEDAFDPNLGKNITDIGNDSKSDKAKKAENKVKSGNQRSVSDKLADATKDISQNIEDALTPDKYDDFNDAENDLKSGYPEVIYPDKKWAWDRADPKPRTENAEAGWLNVIELAHWATFPLGFLVAAYIFDNSKAISNGVVGGILNASPASVFLFILSVMCQCFGAGVSRGALYAYSGWQAAPFRNPLKGPIDNFMVEVTKNNDAWLRSVVYELTIGFQSIGLGLFTMAAYGISNWTKALVGVTTAIFLLGPKKPRMTWTHNDKHIIPLSKSLALAFGVNVVANLFANYKLFYPAMKSAWDGPTLGFIGSILSPVLIWAGGMIAGIKAETSYDQKWHLVALAFVCGGISFSGNVWRQFVAFN